MLSLFFFGDDIQLSVGFPFTSHNKKGAGAHTPASQGAARSRWYWGADTLYVITIGWELDSTTAIKFGIAWHLKWHKFFGMPIISC
ncbi:hypothetical protein KDI_14710 [Dictyobacter arantiisoli]|uniref:Uncharacterized protein n=1 Tax=Dictyobacter arantiisoli TaxID=2014874 RepID=A0A5A5T9A7_9CHLR|nr:hypothetical protein KDI_14710 [Dictyobacter arantiisoli]